ncbi:MAG: HAMP domain-containing histidine kinase [Clostridiales bacterium]|nr:HAMP domain-containing histidine kinase [Clostridiales bacterium]
MKKYLFPLFILLFINISNSETQEPESILIINSYNESYNWTNNMMDGLLENLDQTLDIRVEYMDAKNGYQKEDLELFSTIMEHKYNNNKFDAIIATDDYAFQYVLKNQNTLFKNTPIFFAGINSEEGYNFDSLNKVFGIIEKASISETIEIAQILNPNLREIHFIVDQSISGKKTEIEVFEALDAHFNVIVYNNDTLDEITNKLSTVQSDDAIVLLAYYIVDPRGIFHDTNVMTEKICTASNVPVYGLYEFSMDYGIVGGKLISGYEQGKRVTEIMNNYFLGKYNEQYIETNQSNIHKYDYNELDAFDLNHKLLPSDSVIHHMPVTFFNRHKSVILAGLSIGFVLMLYILILKRQVRFHTKRNIVYNNQLNESDKLASLGEMIKRISHELNTPLGNSITTSSYIEKLNHNLIEQFNSGKLSKKTLLENLNHIEYSTELLTTSLNTANELMTAFRIFSEHNEDDSVITFDLKYYLQNLIKTYNPLLTIHHNKILLSGADNLFIVGKTKEYYKIFNHLIRNSIEHGFENLEHKEIRIDISKSKKELLINYSDNGIGIPKQNANLIFKHFYSSKTDSHFGLGLSQVNEIIARLHGNIQFQNDTQEGVVIKIVIPIKKEF